MDVNTVELLRGLVSTKSHRRTVHTLILLTILVITSLSYSFGRAKATARLASAAPALSGAAAVEYLKGQGLYTELAAAVAEARFGEVANDDPSCGYVARQQFSASDGAYEDGFGFAVAIDGNTIVVGVPFDTLGPVEFLGTAYVFVRQGDRWMERARLFPSDGGVDEYFRLLRSNQR